MILVTPIRLRPTESWHPIEQRTRQRGLPFLRRIPLRTQNQKGQTRLNSGAMFPAARSAYLSAAAFPSPRITTYVYSPSCGSTPHISEQQGVQQGGSCDTVAVDSMNLQPGDEEMLARRLREELTRGL